MSIPKPVILDISEHQLPSDINYDKLAGAIDGVIVRIQYGSRYLDKHYKTHIAAFQKRGIPVAVYAWIRGINKSDMEREAIDFYNRAKGYNPVMWWLDVEEQSMGDMRGGTEVYRTKLKSLGAKKIGVYVANHLYGQFNLDMSKFDGIWIPTYGSNSGQYNGSNPTATSNYNLHQYTSNGRLAGYNGPLDLSRVAKGKFSDFFGTTTASKPTSPSKPSKPWKDVAEDGMWGNDLTCVLQQVYGSGTADGVISGQIKSSANQNVYAAKWGKGGSNLIRVFQMRLKAKGWYTGAIDGNLGPGTVKALQRAFGTAQDGIISPKSNMVKAIQKALNQNKLPF